MNNKVVITGIGLLTPLGNHPDHFFNHAIEGKSAVGPIKKFDASEFSVRIGGEIDTDKEPPLPEKQKREMSTVAWWSVLAARKAVQNAELNLTEEDPFSIDVIVGVSISSLDGIRQELNQNKHVDLSELNSNAPIQMNPACAAVGISQDLGVQGEIFNISTACSSSTYALGYAYKQIHSGHSDCVITGGADEGVTRLFLGSFGNAGYLSGRNSDPTAASRPFEQNRDGYVVSDAACIFILEEYERAKARNAPIYCELSGFGAVSEAVSPFRLGKSEIPGAKAIEKALNRSEKNPEDIDYYCAHGTSDPWVDIRETKMVKRVFGDHANRLPVSSIKSMMGHPMGASGAVQAATCAMAIQRNAIPPTINYEDSDPECDLDYVPNEARDRAVKNAVAYSLGTGGNNAALVLSSC